MRIQCISRPRATIALPTIGTLFSAWHATGARAATRRPGREIDQSSPSGTSRRRGSTLPERKTVRDVSDMTREIRVRLVVRDGVRRTRLGRRAWMPSVGTFAISASAALPVVLRVCEGVGCAGLPRSSTSCRQSAVVVRNGYALKPAPLAMRPPASPRPSRAEARSLRAVVGVTRKRPRGGFHRCRAQPSPSPCRAALA
jgi:hypothetical protein